MSEIRVTYSGLISLVMGLGTVVTGMIFILIVTRSLTPEELGTWGLIGGLVTYVIVLEPIISYWTTREIARDVNSGKTAVVSSGFFSAIGFVSFLIIAFFVSTPTGANVDILFVAGLMIPFTFLNRTLSAIAIGWKPQLNSYGILSLDIAKLPAAMIFVYYMDMGLIGAIMSMIIATSVSILVLAITSRTKIRQSFKKDYLKNWLKHAWIPSYMKSAQFMIFDVLIFSLLTGSVIGLAYWVAATTIGTIVRHSNQITKGVYPKLLSGGNKKHLQSNLMKLFFFAFPFMGFSIAFAKPGLFILNPIYDVAVVVVIFITFRSFLHMLNGAFTQALQGIEKVDTKKSTQKEYLKSKLFYLPSIRMIRRGVYLGSMTTGIFILIQTGASEIELVIYWALISALAQLPFTIYFYYLVRKNFPLSLDVVTIGKYLLTTITIFGGIHFLMEEYLVYDSNIFQFLLNLLPFLFLGFFVYLGITYATDKDTRKLFKAIISEIKQKT